MKKCFTGLLALLLALSLSAALAQDALYVGKTSKKMTIRQSKSTSATKLGSVESGETVSILEWGSEWARIEKEGVVGFILSRNVGELERAGGYDDAGEALYTGTLERDLTARMSKSKSGRILAELEKGSKVYITELGKDWHTIVYHGVTAYIVAGNVLDVAPAREGVELPEGFQNRVQFKTVYTAVADVNLSIRQERNSDSRMIGTVYENEEVRVMETDGQWAYVKKNGVTGYVRGDHLRYYKRVDPFGQTIPGVQWYPYAAHVLRDTPVLNAETGEMLRVVPEGAIISVTALADDMSVTLPYDRITGRIEETQSLEMEDVHAWDKAESGELVAVFATYYDPDLSTEKNAGRLHNIMEGVNRLNGIEIAAGARFSFNELCAPYSKGNGYALGPIINYTSAQKLGYGGGICQVSTTLYDAVLQIPIDIVRWQVHSSYGISYAPLDMDAAVGAGNLDFKIDNVLPYAIRLELQAVGGVLTVRIYRAS